MILLLTLFVFSHGTCFGLFEENFASSWPWRCEYRRGGKLGTSREAGRNFIPLQRLSVTLDDGSQLMPQKSGGTIDMATNRELSFIECGLPFQLAPVNAERITSLSGVIQSMIPGESKKFEIPLVGGSGVVTIDAMTVTLDSVTQNEDLFQVRFSVELKDAGRSLESHRRIYENRVYLQRQDGSRLEHLGFEVLRQTDSGFSVNYLFNL